MGTQLSDGKIVGIVIGVSVVALAVALPFVLNRRPSQAMPSSLPGTTPPATAPVLAPPATAPLLAKTKSPPRWTITTVADSVPATASSNVTDLVKEEDYVRWYTKLADREMTVVGNAKLVTSDTRKMAEEWEVVASLVEREGKAQVLVLLYDNEGTDSTGLRPVNTTAYCLFPERSKRDLLGVRPMARLKVNGIIVFIDATRERMHWKGEIRAGLRLTVILKDCALTE